VENSAALVTRGLDRVLGSLAEIGFDAEWCVLGARNVGAPHIRERIWILGRNTDQDESRAQRDFYDGDADLGGAGKADEFSDPARKQNDGRERRDACPEMSARKQALISNLESKLVKVIAPKIQKI
jgi:DNA (cytosine-5)-methyltransferase 1